MVNRMRSAQQILPTALGLLVLACLLGTAHAKDLEGLKENQLDCLGEGIPKISTGLRCPGDPLDLAEFKRSLKYLPVDAKPEQPKLSPAEVTPLKLAPEITKKTETFKPKVPVWPHSVSIGSPTRGGLYHAVALENSDRLSVRNARNYGTREMVSAIKQAVDDVNKAFPGTPKLAIGNLSRKRGGRLRPHVSHQSGRDADIGYYLKTGHNTRLLKRARPNTLDVKRTWRFIESLIADDKVQYIFSDYRLMRKLYRYARDVKKVDEESLLKIFAYPRGRRARAAHCPRQG